MTRLLIVGLLACGLAAAQTLVCVQQPQSGLFYRNDKGKRVEAAEWACTADQPLSLEDVQRNLQAIGPFTPATVMRLGEFTNRKSRKGRLMTGLELASLGLPFIGVFGQVKEDWIRGLLGAAPVLIPGARKWLSGRPDVFQEAPSAGPFLTVYGRATPLIAIEVPLGPPPGPEPTRFVPSELPAPERQALSASLSEPDLADCSEHLGAYWCTTGGLLTEIIVTMDLPTQPRRRVPVRVFEGSECASLIFDRVAGRYERSRCPEVSE